MFLSPVNEENKNKNKSLACHLLYGFKRTTFDAVCWCSPLHTLNIYLTLALPTLLGNKSVCVCAVRNRIQHGKMVQVDMVQNLINYTYYMPLNADQIGR